MSKILIIIDDCRKALKKLPAESVQCVVTSPPYFGLRDYGVDGQIGLEQTPEEYIAEMVGVFREVRRVLRDDGVVFLNLGDSYVGYKGANYGARPELSNLQKNSAVPTKHNRGTPHTSNGLKSKDLIGIPWRVALALQADGWWLRQDIIWHKPNPMPESVRDRCTKAHEYVFLLTKSARYFWDAEAIAEKAIGGTPGNKSHKGKTAYESGDEKMRTKVGLTEVGPAETRNKRSVWTISTKPYSGAHFAVMPTDLVEPCIKAGTSEMGCCSECGSPWVRDIHREARYTKRQDRDQYNNTPMVDSSGWKPPIISDNGWKASCDCNYLPVVPCTVLDPFGGAGTVGLVADRLGRDAILIELNPEYAEMAQKRIKKDAGFLAQIEVVNE